MSHMPIHITIFVMASLFTLIFPAIIYETLTLSGEAKEKKIINFIKLKQEEKEKSKLLHTKFLIVSN